MIPCHVTNSTDLVFAMDVIDLLQQEQTLSHDFVHYHFQQKLQSRQGELSRYHVAKTHILKHDFFYFSGKGKDALLIP